MGYHTCKRCYKLLNAPAKKQQPRQTQHSANNQIGNKGYSCMGSGNFTDETFADGHAMYSSKHSVKRAHSKKNKEKSHIIPTEILLAAGTQDKIRFPCKEVAFLCLSSVIHHFDDDTVCS